MFMVKLHKPYRGQVDEVLIRADLIVEVTTRRHKSKDDEYIPFPDDPPKKAGEAIGSWLLVDRIGWAPVLETPDEVALAMSEAEALHRARLDRAKPASDTPSPPGQGA